jgi:uroporphyrinogen-III decarboxylase
MVDTGADAISIEKKTDLEVAVRAVKGRASVIGNIDPVRTLLEGSFSDIENAVRMAVHAGINAIAPGCSIAPRTSLDHIRCMVNSARPVAPH